MIQSAWRQAWSWGTRLGSHLANQETALTNARRASTDLPRRRVERDEVELYLDDLESRPEGPEERRGARAAGRGAGHAAASLASTSVSADQPGSRRVVIAEDEALIRMDLAEMLAEEGYDVVGQAGDGESAVGLVEQHRPDLVVLDVKMPRLDGIAAAQRIASQRIAPVVILTAFSQRELVERARDAGAMAYLVKPFTKNDLVPAIEMAISRYAELQMLESEVADLTERLETRKLVDRAKGVLQEQLDLSEPDAFRWIQKTAMDLRLSMRQVAEGVLTHGPAIAAAPETDEG